MNDKIYVAKLGKTVGLKGYLRLFIDSDFPQQFQKNATFSTNKNITLKIEDYNPKTELVKFENYDDIDKAKKLTNEFLYTTLEETKENCKLNKNEYFWFDIVSCQVMENDTILGEIIEIHRYPITDYLEIKTEKSLVQKGLAKTFLIPYDLENYIISVNLESKTITSKNCLDILENS